MNEKIKEFDNVGDLLKFIRWYARVNQKKLAQELGCCINTISGYERNMIDPSYKIIKNLVKYVEKNEIPVKVI